MICIKRNIGQIPYNNGWWTGIPEWPFCYKVHPFLSNGILFDDLKSKSPFVDFDMVGWGGVGWGYRQDQ